MDGLLRSSSAAKIMGLSIDQTIALLTVMREASGRTGREVGNALNSILSYVQRPSSIKTLESLGIEVFTDKARTQFRNVMDIFQDIAAQWPKLSADIQDAFVKAADDAGLYNEELANAIGVQQQWNDLQQRDISQAAAGVYRRNYFIAMIERLTQAQGVLNNMMDAAGYSMRENERTMDTLEKKYNSLKAAVQQLAVALGDAGLLDMLKSIVDTGIDVAGVLSKMNDDTKALVLTVLELLAAFKALQSVLALFTAKGLTTLIGAGAALLGLPPIIGQITAGVIALTGAIGLYAYNSKKTYAQILEDSLSAVNAKKQEIEQTDKEIEETKKLLNNYEELQSKTGENSEVKGQLLEIQKQLASIYPEYVDALDEEGNKLVTNIPLLRETIALKQQELELERQKMLKEAQTTLPQLEAEKRRLEAQIAANRETLAKGDTQTTINARGQTYMIDTRQQLIKLNETLMSQLSAVVEKIYQYKQIVGLTIAEEQDILRKHIQGMAGTTATGTSTGGTDTGVTGTGTGTGDTIYKSSFDANIDRYMLLNSVLNDINNALALNDILQRQANNAEKIKYIENENALLLQQQNALHNINEERRKEASELKNYLTSQGITFDESGDPANYQARLKSLAAYINSLGDSTEAEKEAKEAAIDRYNKVQDSLERYIQLVHTDIPQASNEWHELEGKIKDNQKAIDDLNYSTAENEIQHWAKLGVFGIQQQIDAYEKLYAVKAGTLAEEYQQTEKLFDLYKDLLSEQQQAIKDAYDERIQQIEDEADAKKKAQQEIIDGIEKELALLDRQESEYSYEQKMADLKEQLAYWSVRTSEEARQKVADINKQIAEAEHDREVELQKQKLEDKKKAAQDEIDAIEEAAREERERYEKSYKLVEKAFDKHSINIIARAATMSKEAFQQWVDNYIVPLQNALTSGSLADFESISAGLESGISSLPSHDWGMSDADYQKMMANKERWWELQAAGFKQSTNAEMQRLNAENDAIRRKYGRNPALGEYPKFHEGAMTLSYGLAMFKPGELIFPPDLSTKLEDLISTLYARPVQHSQSSMIDNSKKVQIDTLLNIENNHMEDEVDAQILSRELRMAIDAL